MLIFTFNFSFIILFESFFEENLKLNLIKILIFQSYEWLKKAKSSLEVTFKFMSSMSDISHKIVNDTLSLKATLVTMVC